MNLSEWDGSFKKSLGLIFAADVVLGILRQRLSPNTSESKIVSNDS